MSGLIDFLTKKQQNFSIIETILERDIDFLLLEELNTNFKFTEWFYQRTSIGNLKINKHFEAYHSVSEEDGESDLILIIRNSHMERFALLIENKIDSPPRFEQGIRYKNRGANGVTHGGWKKFETLIVAPKKYLETGKDIQNYESKISYEEIIEWFKINNLNKYRFKIEMLKTAISKQNNRTSQKINLKVTEFLKKYKDEANNIYGQDLSMKDIQGVPSNSNWIYFNNPSIGKNKKLIHKAAGGMVDLQINSKANELDKYINQYSNLLNQNYKMEFQITGKSLSLRVRVPTIDLFEEFDNQLMQVKEGHKAAFRLLSLSPLIE